MGCKARRLPAFVAYLVKTAMLGGASRQQLMKRDIMKIDNTAFGSITIGGETYSHDVIIRLSGKVEKRKKNLSSKNIFGTSHTVYRIIRHCTRLAARS